jgi:hypothetical protein
MDPSGRVPGTGAFPGVIVSPSARLEAAAQLGVGVQRVRERPPYRTPLLRPWPTSKLASALRPGRFGASPQKVRKKFRIRQNQPSPTVTPESAFAQVRPHLQAVTNGDR